MNEIVDHINGDRRTTLLPLIVTTLTGLIAILSSLILWAFMHWGSSMVVAIDKNTEARINSDKTAALTRKDVAAIKKSVANNRFQDKLYILV